jgi:glycosyltransferase involved in cell wall biosynthesis
LADKRILVDLYKVKDLFTGLGQFSANFAQELMRQAHPGLSFTFLVPQGAKGLPEHIDTLPANFPRRYFPGLNKGFDVWHSLHQFPSFLPAQRVRHILTIHDLNFLTEKTGEKSKQYLRALQRNVDSADVITTISNYTKSHLLEHIDLGGKPVRVVYNGVSLPKEDPRKPSYVRGPFFFSLSVFKRAKNFHVLLPLLLHFPGYQLVIGGNNDTDYGAEIKSTVQRLGIEDRVVLPGKIPDAEKLWLYQHCDAFLFPSLAEGFGLPVVEAMMCGKPVVLSRYTSLPEIGGEAAYYFESFEQEAMVADIKKALHHYSANKGQAGFIQNYAERFSWQECIKQYLELYAGA